MFIARQPIFTKSMNIYGYELLYRVGLNIERFEGVSSTSATASVFGGLFEQGIDQIVGNARAFVNFDYILKLIIAYEQANWQEVHRYADIIGIDSNRIYEGYLNAVKWASDVLLTFK